MSVQYAFTAPLVDMRKKTRQQKWLKGVFALVALLVSFVLIVEMMSKDMISDQQNPDEQNRFAGYLVIAEAIFVSFVIYYLGSLRKKTLVGKLHFTAHRVAIQHNNGSLLSWEVENLTNIILTINVPPRMKLGTDEEAPAESYYGYIPTVNTLEFNFREDSYLANPQVYNFILKDNKSYGSLVHLLKGWRANNIGYELNMNEE